MEGEKKALQSAHAERQEERGEGDRGRQVGGCMEEIRKRKIQKGPSCFFRQSSVTDVGLEDRSCAGLTPRMEWTLRSQEDALKTSLV